MSVAQAGIYDPRQLYRKGAFMSGKIIMVLLIGALSIFAQHVAAAANYSGVKYLQIQASYGPLEFVSDGNVIVRDPLGNIVASGKTNERGSFSAELSPSQFNSLPLKVVVTGGRLVNYSSEKKIGKKFIGNLRGQLDRFTEAPWAIVYLDLVSTIASTLEGEGISYDVAVEMARQSLGINKGAPVWVLRFRNIYVDGERFTHVVSGSGGFNPFVKKIATRVKNGKPIVNLKPKKYKTRGSSLKAANGISAAGNAALSAAATESASLACSVPLPNDSGSGNSSTKLVKDFGVIAAQALLETAGAPKGVVTLGKGVTGMLLTGSGSGSNPTLDALKAVQKQLDCISSQIAYLSSEIKALGLQIDLATAAECENAITANYPEYAFLVDIGGTKPLDNTNAQLKNAVERWNPDGAVMTKCDYGKAINNMLWGTSTLRDSAWQTLNKIYQSEGAWYTQADVQGLQVFLDNWSTLLYQEFILSNEYYNYNEKYDDAKYRAGTSQDFAPLCRYGSTSTDPTYCVYFSNIHNTYPADLYSDEIAFYGSGLAVIPFPAGLALGVGPNAYNPRYIFEHKNYNGASEARYYPLDAVKASIAYIPPLVNGESSCTFIPDSVETFLCQRNKHELALKSDQLNSLKSSGRGGIGAVPYLLNALQSTPFVKSQLLPEEVGFFAADDVSVIKSFNGLNSTIFTNALLNSAEVTASCSVGYPSCKHYGSDKPIMGTLLGRVWWPGSGGATTYYPPNPRTEEKPDYMH